MLLSFKIVIICFLSLLCFETTLLAAPVSIDFHGKIVENYSNDINFALGTSYYGNISYDTLFCPDLDIDNQNIGSYHFGNIDFSIILSTGITIHPSINDNAATLMNITIQNNSVENLNDIFKFSTPNATIGEFDYDFYNYYAYCSLDIELYDTSGTSFNNDYLPESLEFSNFEPESLYIQSNLFKANISTTTPEPMTLILLGIGFFGMFITKKSK